MSQDTARPLHTPSLLDSIKTYIFNVDVSDYNELERELRKLNTEFDYENDVPAVNTPSVTDYDSSESESDADQVNRQGQKVLNLTPRNKDRDYSVLDDFFNDKDDSPLYHHSFMEESSVDEPTKNSNGDVRSSEAQASGSYMPYLVNDNESLNTIALKFNVSPNMIKHLNALTSDFIFPGQNILVPKTYQNETSSVMEPTLHPIGKESAPMPKKSIFKYPMKRITRFDGSVAGTTLMTSNAFMFRSHVSDKLVIQNGQNHYNVSIPLDSICEILMFDSFDRMLGNIQSTTGVENACEKCTELKFQLCHGTPLHSGDENIRMDLSFEGEEDLEESPTVKILNPNYDQSDNLAGSATPESNNLFDFLEKSSGEIELGHSPVEQQRPLVYSPTCEHEFDGFASRRYSTSKRVNPFSIGEEENKIIIPNYKSSLDPLNNTEGRMRRTDSDTSLATKAFFDKIDENTNHMQTLMDNANKHEFSIFISLHAIWCSRTHGKPSYQFETDEGYSKAHFWVCVPEKDVPELLNNFFTLCPHLSPIDDHSNCLMRCTEDYWKTLTDAILPDQKPQFVPREVDTDLVSEPFSGTLNYPVGKSVLLTEDMVSQLQPYLPCHIIGIDMLLAYSMKIHGMSLRSLYNHCEPYQDLPCILLIKDTRQYVFGAYLSAGIIESPKYYGSGETFLFRLSPDQKCFFWQGSNHYFMMGTHEYFTVGAGDGNFALYLDEMLEKGTSNRSLTFYNEVLSSESSFDVLTVEVWCFTDETIDESDNGSITSEKSRLSGQYRGSFYSIR
ncbi:hypothetical protein ACHWQZ_G002454 [Mnemiopsis leidyi]